MRPYALWLGAYFITAIAFFNWPRWRILSGGTLLLLTFTATAGVFELFALFLAFAVVGLMERSSVAEIVRDGLVLFLIPVLISVYYGYRADVWDYSGDQWGTWATFLAFWQRKAHVFLASFAAVALCSIRRPTWRFAIPSLSNLSTRKLRRFVLPMALLASLVVVTAFSRRSFAMARQDFAKAGYGGVPEDPVESYAELIQKELPKGFCFQDAGTSDAPVQNIRHSGRVVVSAVQSDPRGRQLGTSCPRRQQCPRVVRR